MFPPETANALPRGARVGKILNAAGVGIPTISTVLIWTDFIVALAISFVAFQLGRKAVHPFTLPSGCDRELTIHRIRRYSSGKAPPAGQEPRFVSADHINVRHTSDPNAKLSACLVCTLCLGIWLNRGC